MCHRIQKNQNTMRGHLMQTPCKPLTLGLSDLRVENSILAGRTQSILWKFLSKLTTRPKNPKPWNPTMLRLGFRISHDTKPRAQTPRRPSIAGPKGLSTSNPPRPLNPINFSTSARFEFRVLRFQLWGPGLGRLTYRSLASLKVLNLNPKATSVGP